jgi:pantoate--beta-alanine ligase
MILIRDSSELKNYCKTALQSNTIGFVPTMGALHAGHLSLIESSQKDNDITIISIFVNPTQFNESEDFKNYPRTEDADIKLLLGLNPDVVFLPKSIEMYGEQPKMLSIDLEGLDSVMEGRYRAGHFQGVVTIVDKFFELLTPTRAYFGQKDFQQLAIIQHLAAIRHPSLKIIGCPIIREADGLAMSSRNTRLNTEERKRSLLISKVLFQLVEKWGSMPFRELMEMARNQFSESSVELEYLEIVDVKNLKSVVEYSEQPLIACIAARVGTIRLIDNMFLPRS